MTEKEENTKSDMVLREERVLEFWQKNKIFDKSLKQTEGGKEFIFYEGPPTANGKPGIHHLEARAFKDAIPRYKTMQGYHVRRKGGWDTHGLPVELQVEKKLGLNSKKAIEEYGIARFNQKCQESVWEYLNMWEKFTERIGFWLDQENPYVTYHNNFIESVWNVVKKVDKQGLLYKDYKVVPWCPRCGTVLSSHELALGYEDVKDLSIYAKFKIRSVGEKFSQVLGKNPQTVRKSSPDSALPLYFLAWTTTPWTLPGNVALAVGEKIIYVKVKLNNEIFILAKERISILPEPYEILEEIHGQDLIGLEYEPLFPYLAEIIPENEKSKLEKAYKVYGADFVTTIDGTGIVHTAVMYGQDDFELGTKVGLPKHHLVNSEGKFIKGTGLLEGRFVKEKDNNNKPTLDVDIIKYLTDKNLFFKKENYEHSYPHCWRCKTALIYYARDSWYFKMSDQKIKEKLIAENKKINWEPSHIGEGRFGEWLREVKDWAISRERYWGTPLPVWECSKCNKKHVIGSLEELKKKTKKSGNKYFVMRHGEAGNNIKNGIHHRDLEYSAKLTEKGKKQVLESLRNFKERVDIIISSTFERAKETTEIVCGQINFPLGKVIYNQQIKEQETSSFFDGKDKAVFDEYYDGGYLLDNPNEILPDSESFAQVIKRIGQFIYDLETNYSNKNILIIGHGNATNALSFIVKGLSLNNLSSKNNPFISLKNAEIRGFDFIPLPHNENFELDLHRPYIDEINLVCECGSKLTRTKEVMDVWLDSGTMPFAQDHYPFENKDWVEGKGYPADYISEAIDQTRGWFYTLHAVGVLMGRGRAFKNVICLGHLLDATGKKMSKSLGNIVNPWVMIEKYGADTLRLWMYSVNQPGESKNFDEKTVALLSQQVFGLLYNVLAFYELYRDRVLEKNNRPKISKNVLDIWILAKLDELIGLSTKNLDNYKLLEPVRGMKDFIGDLSTWYLRRSRERIKEGDVEAKQTLYFVLKTLTKLLAPFAPLSAEDIWLRLKNDKDTESVHLVEWPKMSKRLFDIFGSGEDEILKNMQTVRDICTAGKAERQRLNIPIRQPLNRLDMPQGLPIEYVEIIKSELNVKSLNYTLKAETGIYKIGFDSEITPGLKQEGNYRELVRALQDMRKKMELTPSDVIAIAFETNDMGKALIGKFEADIKKTVLVSKIEFKANDGQEIKIDELVFKVKIDK